MTKSTHLTVSKQKGLSPALEPRLRLFVSVDLVGSTAFKQSQRNHIIPKDGSDELRKAGPDWFKTILNFYGDFENLLITQWGEYNSNVNNNNFGKISKPVFWKSVGDELLYTFDILTPRDAAGILILWISTLENYRKKLKANEATLDIKSSAWVAGFPLMNSEVIFENNPQNNVTGDSLVRQFSLLNEWYKKPTKRDNLTKDYIGPAIDTGFRISTKASIRKLVISVELAFLITGVVLDSKMSQKFSIFFDGTETFKGVVGGRPYPVFWIAVDGIGELVKLEDTLAKRTLSNHVDIKN